MRTFSKLMIAACVAAMAIGFVACGDDDDDNGTTTTGGSNNGGGNNEAGNSSSSGGSSTGGTTNEGGGAGDTNDCSDGSCFTAEDCINPDGPTDAVLNSGIGAVTGGGEWLGDWVNFGMSYDYEAVTDTDTLDGTALTDSQLADDTELSADEVYLLTGTVYVPDGVTLTIPAGTVIRGDGDTKGTLIVARGGKIDAQGTADAPIVFTSNAENPDAGDWGGVILLGKAPNAKGDEVNIEGTENDPMNQFGGDEASDDSGTMTYVRIEYPGVDLGDGDEINGLTLGSVGSDTSISYISVVAPLDDAFEFFGGTVDADHLVAVDPGDDMFDTDDGYQGTLEYLFGRHSMPQSGDPNGLEWDGTEDYEGTPNSDVTAQYITVCGEGDLAQLAYLLRKGGEGSVDHFVGKGFADGSDSTDWNGSIGTDVIVGD